MAVLCFRCLVLEMSCFFTYCILLVYIRMQCNMLLYFENIPLFTCVSVTGVCISCVLTFVDVSVILLGSYYPAITTLLRVYLLCRIVAIVKHYYYV